MNQMFNIVDGFGEALDTLRVGGLAGVPTETVYGLAADATNDAAVSKIFTAKGRPSFNPLICHVSDFEMAARFGVFSDTAQMLAGHFWPGPLTLVVPLQANSGIAAGVTAELDTIALRQPTGVMAKLAAELGHPIAAPSANSSGKISPTTAQHVADDLGERVDFILDDGPCSVGVESTIVKVEGENVTLLREGGMPVEMLEEHLGTPVLRPTRTVAIESPGQLLTHYAPSLPLRLNADSANNGEALLAFGPTSLKDAALNLSEIGDLSEAARNLFAMLKQLDASGATGIAVQSIPKHGLGAAINDRLTRAAHREEKLENAE